MEIIPREIWCDKGLYNFLIIMKNKGARIYTIEWCGRSRGIWDNELCLNSMVKRGVVHIGYVESGRHETSGWRFHWCWDQGDTGHIRDYMVYIRWKWRIIWHSWSHRGWEIKYFHGILISFNRKRDTFHNWFTFILKTPLTSKGHVLHYHIWFLLRRGVEMMNNSKRIMKMR